MQVQGGEAGGAEIHDSGISVAGLDEYDKRDGEQGRRKNKGGESFRESFFHGNYLNEKHNLS